MNIFENSEKKQRSYKALRIFSLFLTMTEFHLSGECIFDKEESWVDPTKKNKERRTGEEEAAHESKWWNSSFKNSSFTWIFLQLEFYKLDFYLGTRVLNTRDASLLNNLQTRQLTKIL